MNITIVPPNGDEPNIEKNKEILRYLMKKLNVRIVGVSLGDKIEMLSPTEVDALLMYVKGILKILNYRKDEILETSSNEGFEPGD